LAKKSDLFFKNNFKRNNHGKFIHHECYLKPFLSYLPCIVCREYFSIIFNVKKCAPYAIKCGTLKLTKLVAFRLLFLVQSEKLQKIATFKTSENINSVTRKWTKILPNFRKNCPKKAKTSTSKLHLKVENIYIKPNLRP
jgi:hypothetical protein